MLRATLVALVVLLSACTDAPVAYEPVHHYDPARDAAKDIDDAVAEAARSGKRVLLEVGGAFAEFLWTVANVDFQSELLPVALLSF